MTTAALFTPFTLGTCTLPNRIAMAPMTRRKSPDRQIPTEATAAYYARRAAGGVGLIITEGTRFDPLRRADTEDVPGLITAEQCDAWRSVIRAVREANPETKLALQLWHCGRQGLDPVGPSAIPAKSRTGGFKPTPHALSASELHEIARFFAEASVRAMETGFHAVEIHGAHTYLLDSFLSPTANQRADEFGGPFENRMRFPIMCARAVREAVGPEYPVLFRFSQWKFDPAEPDTFPDPQTLGVFVRALRDAGVTALHASTGEAVAPVFADAADQGLAPRPRTLAGWTRALSGLPTIAVGRVSVSASMGDDEQVETRDPATAAALIESGEADLIAVGRALIANPDWCRAVKAGKWRELKPYNKAMLETLA
jgi:2,4-dienoyl-CoA reductase-like NADH-dependent reductase (Old Yellow Enzyme family)